jgi:hypothetical protein
VPGYLFLGLATCSTAEVVAVNRPRKSGNSATPAWVTLGATRRINRCAALCTQPRGQIVRVSCSPPGCPSLPALLGTDSRAFVSERSHFSTFTLNIGAVSLGGALQD